MTGLPANVHAEIAKVLGSGDKAAAADLAGRIAAAQASGDAKGFSDDLARLQALAGIPVAKRAPGGSFGTLAKGHPDAGWQERDRLRKGEPLAGLTEAQTARARIVMAKMRSASTPSEICAAREAGDELVADVRRHAAMKAAFNPRLGKTIVEGLRQ